MQLVLGVAGTVLMPFDPALGFSLGWTVGSLIWPEKLPGQSVGKLNDLHIVGSGYGAMIPIVYGTARIGGNVIWATNLVEHTSTHTEGGKGGGGVEVTEYTYTASFAVGICEGPIAGIKRIWAEDVLLGDARPERRQRQLGPVRYAL